jgi:hypothetical protein
VRFGTDAKSALIRNAVLLVAILAIALVPVVAATNSPVADGSPAAKSRRIPVPKLKVKKQTLAWNNVAKGGSYTVESNVRGGKTTYVVVAALAVTPPAVPGHAVRYRVRTSANRTGWSKAVVISYPPETNEEGSGHEKEEKSHEKEEKGHGKEEHEEKEKGSGEEEAQPGKPILGIVGGSGSGPEVAHKVQGAGFKSERLEAGVYTSDRESYDNGFRNDQIIVGNIDDAKRLKSVRTATWVNATLVQVEEAVSFGYTLLEVGNEMYLKGGVSEPVKYAEMYMALARAIDAAGIHGVTLIFNSFGDYETEAGGLSTLSGGGGWLGDALKAEPELKQRVSAFSTHPYGIPGTKYVNGDWGIEGLEAQHADVLSLGFAHTDYYATEYGESEASPSSPQIQAERIKLTYNKLLAMPYVKGIWYYQLHDDSTGKWGLVSGVWEPRPALGVIETFIRAGD